MVSFCWFLSHRSQVSQIFRRYSSIYRSKFNALILKTAMVVMRVIKIAVNLLTLIPVTLVYLVRRRWLFSITVPRLNEIARHADGTTPAGSRRAASSRAHTQLFLESSSSPPMLPR